MGDNTKLQKRDDDVSDVGSSQRGAEENITSFPTGNGRVIKQAQNGEGLSTRSAVSQVPG